MPSSGLAVRSEFNLAALFLVLGIFFDFLDGLAARALKVQSNLGLQLDSLADMVTSGLVPGIVMFKLLRFSLTNPLENSWNVVSSSPLYVVESEIFWRSWLLPTLGFLITLASAYRLAKFNIDDRQTTSFIGLPTPANALLIVSIGLMVYSADYSTYNPVLLHPGFLIGLTLLSSYLLNAKMQLFAFKFKSWGFKANALRYSFIGMSIVLLVTLKVLAIPIIIGFYIISSLVANQVGQKESY